MNLRPLARAMAAFLKPPPAIRRRGKVYLVKGHCLCEHCHDTYTVRNDHLRGWVCPDCDAALAAMRM